MSGSARQPSTTSTATATKVKLCGLRGIEDARAAVMAGADLVGIVLVPGSRRCVTAPRASAMAEAIRQLSRELGRFAPEIVGVVGDVPLSVAHNLVDTIRLDAVQLVGTDDQCRDIAGVIDDTALIRTISVPPDADPARIRRQVEEWEARGARIVFDAAVSGQLGGTGIRIRGDVIHPVFEPGRHGLAGGLDPDNVADAIRELRPALVDVSSGIEASSGHKHAPRMHAFVAAARAALIDVDPPT